MTARSLADLQTPALVLDRGKLQRNIQRMARRAAELGVPLRPHLKTPKSIPVARLLLDAGAQGFCVSTLQEAEFFSSHGLNDLFYCVPFSPNKARRAAQLVAGGCQLTLMIDSVEGAQANAAALESAFAALAHSAPEGIRRLPPVPVVVEIDVDGYRTGASLEGDDILRAAQTLQESAATRFAGIASYAGASYGETPEGAARLAARHVAALQQARRRLEDAGLPCDVVSLGSTPAVLHADAMPGITESRCGIYVFQDLFQAGIGAARVEDVAVSVLTSVLARHQRHNRFVVDAGGLALSKDRSTADRTFDAGYGLVCDAVTGSPIGDLVVQSVSQELGLVTSRSGARVALDDFPVGRLLRILPNHADMTAAAYESYHVVQGADRILDVWTRTNRWA
jgi:D-serine deaminase-like pyridoxal phosphate-dependent protein